MCFAELRGFLGESSSQHDAAYLGWKLVYDLLVEILNHIYLPFLLSAVSMAQGVMMLRREQAITPKSRGIHDRKKTFVDSLCR